MASVFKRAHKLIQEIKDGNQPSALDMSDPEYALYSKADNVVRLAKDISVSDLGDSGDVISENNFSLINSTLAALRTSVASGWKHSDEKEVYVKQLPTHALAIQLHRLFDYLTGHEFDDLIQHVVHINHEDPASSVYEVHVSDSLLENLSKQEEFSLDKHERGAA